MFFTGLSGCVLVVLVSWVSIFKSGFSNEDEHSANLHEGHGPQNR